MMISESTLTFSITRRVALSLGLATATACGSTDSGTGAAENGVNSASGGAGAMITTNSGGAAGTCAAGSGVTGGGADTCPNLPWRCVDEMVGSPASHLVGAECSSSHPGACCNYNDKCLTMTDGKTGSQSAVEVASGPCQAGCVLNSSAQACLDCINANLTGSGLPALSAGCGTCFIGLITCSATNCITQCLTSSTAPGCRECVFDNCTFGPGKYNECAGVLGNAGVN
jgi:hypothetical protein